MTALQGVTPILPQQVCDFPILLQSSLPPSLTIAKSVTSSQTGTSTNLVQAVPRATPYPSQQVCELPIPFSLPPPPFLTVAIDLLPFALTSSTNGTPTILVTPSARDKSEGLGTPQIQGPSAADSIKWSPQRGLQASQASPPIVSSRTAAVSNLFFLQLCWFFILASPLSFTRLAPSPPLGGVSFWIAPPHLGMSIAFQSPTGGLTIHCFFLPPSPPRLAPLPGGHCSFDIFQILPQLAAPSNQILLQQHRSRVIFTPNTPPLPFLHHGLCLLDVSLVWNSGTTPTGGSTPRSPPRINSPLAPPSIPIHRAMW